MSPVAEPDGSGGPHVLVASLDAPILDDEDRHHLARVLRLRPGDPITIADGVGRWCPARFGPTIDLIGDPIDVPAPAPPIAVAFAPVKGDRPEWTIQKLTELGVDEILPIVAARSVIRWDAERAARQHERWLRIVRGAAAQSRRVWLPHLAPIRPVEEVVAERAAVLADLQAPPLVGIPPLVVIGPEGGWTDEERRLAPRHGLGPRVLRAETAALATAAVLCARRAGL